MANDDELELPGSYQQLCVIAAALDVVGSRWALIILRDLARTPLRFTDLQNINPSISPTLLSTRLRELEADGIIEQQKVPAPGRGSVYALTEWAAPAVSKLITATADFGASLLEHRGVDDLEHPEQILARQMELNGTFVAAQNSSLRGYFKFDLSGIVNHVVLTDDGMESFTTPPGDDPPVASAWIFPPTVLMRLMGRVTTLEAAEADGLVVIEGDRLAMVELLELLSLTTVNDSG